jgi:two-component system alkaline phosphatase synthesis response regulator PhoP
MKKILLVDDEESLLEIMKLNLEATGKYEVQTESQGLKAVERAKAFKPDLIFLDIVMPDIDGSEVAYLLKEDPALASIPVIFLTATVTSEEVKGTGQKIGGQIFLAKPVSLKQLIECIEKNAR